MRVLWRLWGSDVILHTKVVLLKQGLRYCTWFCVKRQKAAEQAKLSRFSFVLYDGIEDTAKGVPYCSLEKESLAR